MKIRIIDGGRTFNIVDANFIKTEKGNLIINYNAEDGVHEEIGEIPDSIIFMKDEKSLDEIISDSLVNFCNKIIEKEKECELVRSVKEMTDEEIESVLKGEVDE